MKNKDRKKIQLLYAKENISHYFNLLEQRFCPKYDSLYVKEIQILSQGFNIRLDRDQKLKFCKKCRCFWNIESREIRFNPRLCTKEYICRNCGFVRRFRYK